MNNLRIYLFGKFNLLCGNNDPIRLEVRKVQELLSYLLLSRRHNHPREFLAGILWSEYTTAQSKKYLRQTLWQLQATLESQMGNSVNRILIVEPDWVALDSETSVWLDVEEFESTFAITQSIPGHHLNEEHANLLRYAVELYRGDLLEGWYQDWCLYERERLQNMLLTMLDKLIDYFESSQQYEMGLIYGNRALRFEPASERTHQQMMRLHYFLGDRTAALRQYQQCVQILKQELDVSPATNTKALYQQIKDDTLNSLPEASTSRKSVARPVQEMTLALEQLRMRLTELQNQIQIIELAMNNQR